MLNTQLCYELYITSAVCGFEEISSYIIMEY